MIIEYTALRNIQTGNSSGTNYTLSLGVSKEDVKPYWVGAVNESLSGNRVSTTHYDGLDYDITTLFLNDSSTSPTISDMREFLNSVRRGETFLIDGNQCVIRNLSLPYSEKRIGPSHKEYSFKIRVL